MKLAARTVCRRFGAANEALIDSGYCRLESEYSLGEIMKKLLILTAFLPLFAFADEGMWTLNEFPVATVASKYKFKATAPWLEQVRLASARLAGGCSASFVSTNGLVMTNHHCVHSCIEQISKSGTDRVANGFYAKTAKDEVKCPEIEVNKLLEIKDVTAKIQTATKALKGKVYNDRLKAEMSKMEKECSGGSDATRCDVVTLYHGGKYNLYKYQRYQDVRLAFAPELSIAFFGGDPDNFNFPRYDLDVAFLRVYDQDKPLQTKDYFRWSPDGAKEGELTFVTGHPGRTSRLMTIAELEFLRDVKLPKDLLYASELRGLLTEFQNRGKEQKRISGGKLFGVENWLKAMKGRHQALTDKQFFSQKVAAQNALIRKVNANDGLKSQYGMAWAEIAKAQEALKKIYQPLVSIENNTFGSKLFEHAKNVVRAAAELPKANEVRFREFADSNLPRLKQNLFSEAPIYNEFEVAMLTFHLKKLRENLTADHPFVKKVLGKTSPERLAEELVENTRLKDVKVRKTLFEGGQKAIDESKDPMVQLALLIDPDAREIRKKYEDEIESKFKQNGERVAKALFATSGGNIYPDATFTLRASYGSVKGWDEKGAQVAPFTTITGAYERHTGSDPFALPQTWLKAQDKVKMGTRLNFVTTNDIIGGNSGSPVINQKAEIVGLVFDGNIHSLGGEYGFDPRLNRTVAVHSSAIMEALVKIYGADRIANDLLREQLPLNDSDRGLGSLQPEANGHKNKKDAKRTL